MWLFTELLEDSKGIAKAARVVYGEESVCERVRKRALVCIYGYIVLKQCQELLGICRLLGRQQRCYRVALCHHLLMVVIVTLVAGDASF